MTWFEDALDRHGANVDALVPALAEWFGADVYRGCAFINAVVEVGPTMPEAVAISRRHKLDMATSIQDAVAGVVQNREGRFSGVGHGRGWRHRRRAIRGIA